MNEIKNSVNGAICENCLLYYKNQSNERPAMKAIESGEQYAKGTPIQENHSYYTNSFKMNMIIMAVPIIDIQDIKMNLIPANTTIKKDIAVRLSQNIPNRIITGIQASTLINREEILCPQMESFYKAIAKKEDSDDQN